MLRRLVCVLLVRSLLGLGVDDTEKRRSEEILRAVSAAATADYEGLQQMKFQKSQTVTRLESAINTRRCVTKLIEALNKEQATLSQQGDTMNEEANKAETQIDEEKLALQEAIQKAIQEVYGEVKRRYIKLKNHSSDMMDALKEEVEHRTSVIDGDSTPEKLFEAIMENAAVQLNAAVYTHAGGQGYEVAPLVEVPGSGGEKAPGTCSPGCSLVTDEETCRQTFDAMGGDVDSDWLGELCDTNSWDGCNIKTADTDGQPHRGYYNRASCAEYPPLDQEYDTYKKYVACTCPKNPPTGLDPEVVQQHLAKMMLHSAVVDAYKRDNTTGIREDSYDYINMENLLLMAGSSQTSDLVNVDDKSFYSGGPFTPRTTRTDTWRDDKNVSSTVHPKDNLLVGMFNMKMTQLEKENLKKLEKQFVDWTVAKSEFHNVSIQKSAVDSALDMVKGKIGALETSLESIKIYDLELLSLEDDEMRRIADIKEEFESLAADWLQLATYHCCDIIQGNTVECTDATAHLMQPINNVFPGALKAPDPGRDCVRRLL